MYPDLKEGRRSRRASSGERVPVPDPQERRLPFRIVKRMLYVQHFDPP